MLVLVLLDLVLVLLCAMAVADEHRLCARLNRQHYWSIGRRARLCTAGSWYLVGPNVHGSFELGGWALSHLSAAAMGQLFIQNTEGNGRSRAERIQ